MTRRRRTGLSKDDSQLWSKVTETVVPLESQKANLGDLLGSTAAATPTTPAAPVPPKSKKPKRSDKVKFVEDTRPPLAPGTYRLGNLKPGRPQNTISPAPSIAESLSSQPVLVDAKTFGKIRKGKQKPEGRIDLHGMTMAQAHPALNRFIFDSYSKQRRLVLVITGKGKDRDDGSIMPVRRGVLRHQVPHWLQAPALSSMVLQILPAHLRHGGDGAYYVYLRRQRG